MEISNCKFLQNTGTGGKMEIYIYIYILILKVEEYLLLLVMPKLQVFFHWSRDSKK